GLGIVPGAVRRFPGRKVPQIGWNQTLPRPGSTLFRGLPDKTFFYYIHSYYAAPLDPSVSAAEADYYLRYCSAVERGALSAVQFHPEKSGAAGLQLLNNWAEAKTLRQGASLG
ncbi:MAG: imidazole glycerol phosphate synthase subunit HisH, partial [Treponema sp.]|nr:imidazole glycerol phosphate synthase subunit HisH [Treponema sp.]